MAAWQISLWSWCYVVMSAAEALSQPHQRVGSCECCILGQRGCNGVATAWKMKFKIVSIYRARLFWLSVRCDLFLLSTCWALSHFILPPVSLGKSRALHLDSPGFPTDLSHAANHFWDVGVWGFLWSNIRGRVSVYGPSDKSHGCCLSTGGSACLSRPINSGSLPPVMHPRLQRLLWMWKLTNLYLSADGLTTLIPSVALSGNIQQSTHTGQRFNCAKPSSLNVAIL